MGLMDLFKAWRKEEVLNEALDEFISMIGDCHWMYQTAATSLWEETDIDARKKAIRERDVAVNKMERSVRKKIVQHLAIRPGENTNFCLVMMSVAKDAERLGDYAKNMVEVSEFKSTKGGAAEIVDELKQMEEAIDNMFPKVAEAFREADEKAGQELVEKQTGLLKQCDQMITKILQSDQLTMAQAVCYALLARYYKRFAAHLGNIASSLVMPVHKLDYYDEDDLKEPTEA
jgi:phosphate uptake regulator